MKRNKLVETIFVSVLAVGMCFGCAGCEAVGNRQDMKQQSESASSDASKTKIANSIPDYIDFLLELDAKPETKYPMSDQQRKKFNEDENRCYNTEVIAVTGVYQMQVGNPGMLSDGDQAMVDCLHKAGIVPKNYGKEAYKKDLEAHAKDQPTTVDFLNTEMQSCWVANGASFGDVNDTDQWKPLG